jgi:hypothetical protein
MATKWLTQQGEGTSVGVGSLCLIAKTKHKKVCGLCKERRKIHHLHKSATFMKWA